MTPEIRLLLVDDDEANREVLRRRLVRSGYAVDTAADGTQALAAVRSRAYDLVLLDNMMPVLSGPQVLQRIRETWPAAELPVIMVTALDDSEHLVTALREGANDYLTKPLDFPVALARIESHLRVASVARETRRARELYQLASRASDDGLWEWDPEAGTVRYDRNWLSTPQDGGNSTTVTLEKWLEEAHPGEHAAIRRSLESSLTEDAGLNCEYRVLGGDGRCGWAELRGRVLRNAAGEPVRVVGHLSNITGRKTIDPLTTLPNRLWLAGEIHQALTDGHQPALLLFDIDGFERMEESFPEGSTGRLLVAVTARLREFLKDHPTTQAVVARCGEHQFGVLLRQVAGPSEARDFAERLRDVLRQPIDVDGEEVFAAASIGIAVLPQGSAEEEAFRNAGAALRHARELGGGRTEMFQEHQRHLAIVETRLENDLRRALENCEFEVHYQPKVRLGDGEITSLEALVRWNRPGQGMLLPNLFIPAAERTGLVVPLGKWVLERAANDVAKLRSRYPALGVSVNVSGRQLAEPDLVEQIAASLTAAGLAPTALHLEITETFLVQDPEMALTKLARIRSMGVGLKLDDFGSGYASLDYLQRFPFDSIKVDRSFVARLHSSRESAEIMRAVIGLAHSLDMSVIAEGIETPEQLNWLREMGCNFGQGYLFSRPVSLDQIARLLEDAVRRKSAGTRDGMTATESRAGCEEARNEAAWSTAGVVVSGETD